MHYNGYVATNSFDMTGGNVKAEMVKAATGGADSIFAIAQMPTISSASWSTVPVSDQSGTDGQRLDGIERPLDTTTNQLVIQVRLPGF